MPDDKKNTDEVSGRSLWDFILTILRDRKLLMIALPLALVAAGFYIYLQRSKDDSGTKHDKPGPPPTLPCTTWTLMGKLVSDSGEYVNIKGIRLGVQSDPLVSADQVNDGFFMIGGFRIPQNNIIVLTLDGNGHGIPLNPVRFDSSVIRPDYGGCNLTFNQPVIVPDADLRQMRPPVRPSPPPPHGPRAAATFSINIDDDALQQQIAQISKLRYDPSSRVNNVVVTFDTINIISAGSGVYTFVSSSPIVKVNNRTFTLSGCTIPAPLYTSHDRQLIMKQVRDNTQTVATPYLRTHANLIAKWISGS